MNTTFLSRSFQYDAWANRRTLTSLQQTPGIDERSIQVIAHVLAAQQIWLRRLTQGDTSGLVVWPALTLNQCEVLLKENQRSYQSFLASLTEENLARTIDYRTSTGVAMQSGVGDILNHVLLHGAYHRGQLAQSVKRAGGTPAATDFILFAREQ